MAKANRSSIATQGGICPPIVASNIEDYKRIIVDHADSVLERIEHWSEINTANGLNLRLSNSSFEAIETAILNLRHVLEGVKIESRPTKPAALIGRARGDSDFQRFLQQSLAKGEHHE